MKTSRQAVLRVSRELFDAVLPEGKTITSVSDTLGVDLAWVAEALKLPRGTKVTGVSVHARFLYDEVLVRLSHPDFVETQSGCALPEVVAVWDRDESGQGRFLRWEGPAVRSDLPNTPVSDSWRDRPSLL